MWGQSGCLPQGQLDGAKFTSVEVFCICLNWNHPLSASLAQALIKALCSLFQLGLSRRGTHTDKCTSARALGGKGLVGSLRSRPSTFGVRDTELREIPRRTWGGRESILQSPNFPSTSLLQPETLSMEEMEIQEDSYSSKHGKGSSLKLTTNTSVCCDFGFHKGSFSQEGSCTQGNGDLWMQLIFVTTNKQTSKLNQIQIKKVPPFPLLFVPTNSELLGTIKNKRQLQKKNKVPRIITTQIFIQQWSWREILFFPFGANVPNGN